MIAANGSEMEIAQRNTVAMDAETLTGTRYVRYARDPGAAGEKPRINLAQASVLETPGDCERQQIKVVTTATLAPPCR